MEAVEVLTTGTCPLDCEYCYIPKTEEMKDLHRNIVSNLDEHILTLPKDVKHIGLWGTEPALTLKQICDLKPQLLERYENLREISLSTSLMIPKPIEQFIHEFSDWNGTLDIQISLDGPAFITDVNRVEGAAENIPHDFLMLVNRIDPKEAEVEFSWKATLQKKNLKALDKDSARIDQFENYFRSINEEFDRARQSNRVILKKGSYVPTLAVPGRYTSADGKLFGRVLKAFHARDQEMSYDSRFKRLLDFRDEFHKRKMFSCSGGDSQLGISKGARHICHRTFYYDDERYVDSVLKTDISNWDISKFEKGTLDHIKDRFIVSEENEEDLTRFEYVLRGYHDFWKMQQTYIHAMMIELARAEQANERFLHDKEFRDLFATFDNTALSCPMENLLNTGSIHMQPISLLRMFGNGAFEELVNYARRR